MIMLKRFNLLTEFFLLKFNLMESFLLHYFIMIALILPHVLKVFMKYKLPNFACKMENALWCNLSVNFFQFTLADMQGTVSEYFVFSWNIGQYLKCRWKECNVLSAALEHCSFNRGIWMFSLSVTIFLHENKKCIQLGTHCYFLSAVEFDNFGQDVPLLFLDHI